MTPKSWLAVVAVIGGLAVSTLLTLVVIPIMYDRLDRKSDASYKARRDAARAAAAGEALPEGVA